VDARSVTSMLHPFHHTSHFHIGCWATWVVVASGLTAEAAAVTSLPLELGSACYRLHE